MYDKETVELALAALAEGLSLRGAAAVAGVSASCVANWSRGFVPGSGRCRGRLSVNEKYALASRALGGERPADLAMEAGCSDRSVRAWATALAEGRPMPRHDSRPGRTGAAAGAGAGGEEALRARVRELELRNAVLEKTVEVLKKGPGAGPSELTARERAAVARALRDRFPLGGLLAELGLARSTFYYHCRPGAGADRDAALRPLVREAFAAGGGAYGYRRVRASLPGGGAGVSEKVVRRVMREEGLSARPPRRARRWSSYAGERGLAGAPNLLLLDAERDLHEFRAPAPGLAFSTDISEFSLPGGGRKLYLSPMVDLYDGRIVACSLGDSPSSALVAEMLREGARHMAGRTAILHSDRGWHYRTPAWVEACARLGVVRSLSRKAHSPDNAVCEGLFGRLKAEMFRCRDWSGATWEELRDEVARYVEWYNAGRLKRFGGGYETIDGRRRRLGLPL